MPADGCGFGPFLWSERNRTGARPAPDGVRRKGTTFPISGRRGRPLREVPDGRREAVAVGRDGGSVPEESGIEAPGKIFNRNE